MDQKTLRGLIDYHDNLYYNEGRSEITDAEYDALRAKLEDDDYVPGGTTGLFPKYQHTIPITSLSKATSEESLRKECARLLPAILMPKYDGLTVVVYPDGAKVTRGSGEVGDDISVNFNKICNRTFPFPVRGEAIISRDDFEALNINRKKDGKEPFENRRNAAAGILRSKDGNYMEYIRFVTYHIVGSDLPLSDQLYLLEEAGFRTADAWEFGEEDTDKVIEFVTSFERDKYMFEIDGFVLKSNMSDSENFFGRTSHHPKDAVAYKFPAQGGWTTLRDVVWTVGRTGKITPNAVFEPITILDATVQNATLHNQAIMQAIGLTKGCEIFVVKANDVIPAVIESRNHTEEHFTVPTVCPDCKSKLEQVKDQLYCRNEECVSRLVENISAMAARDRLNIDGLSSQTIEKMVNHLGIRQSHQIFDVTKDEILRLPGFAEKSAEKLYQAIQRAKTQPLDRVISGALIPLIGRTASKNLANFYGTPEAFLDDLSKGLKNLSIEGFGETMRDSLTKYAYRFMQLYGKIDEILLPQVKETNNALSIAITGKLEHPRDYYVELIESAGHEFSKSVTKKTTHLLAGEKAGSKIEKASAMGVKILTSEEELQQLLSK